jgi:hypothetical protein
MSDPKRFRRRRQLLRARGICIQCADRKAVPGRSKCEECANIIGIKKLVAPARRIVCEKRARLERNLIIIRAAEQAVLEKLSVLPK